MSTKTTILTLLAGLGLVASTTPRTLACGGGHWSIDWAEPVTEAMELFAEAVMAEEVAAAAETERERKLTAKAQSADVFTALTIDVIRSSNGEPLVDLQWTAEEGKRYTVERSAGLDAWKVLTDNHVHRGSGNTATYSDHTPKGQRSRAFFYRVSAD